MSKDTKYRIFIDPDVKYNRKWEKKFKWLAASDKGQQHYFCKVCRKHYPGGLRQITLHCSAKTHMNALVASSSEASIYFVESQPAPCPQKPAVSPKKRRIVEPQSQDEDNSEEAVSPSSKSPKTRKSTELIHLKTYTSPVDGKKIVLGMERRLEPLYKPRPEKVIRQVVAPYSRASETSAAVKSIPQAEAGLLTEEEPAPIVAPANIKVERNSTQATTPQTPVNRVAEPASDAFDVFGKHVANKLRTLTSQQNKFAQKLIMDVLFEGEMEALDRNTKVVKCGVSCVCQQ